MTDNAAIKKIINTYGAPLLAYTLNVPESVIIAAADDLGAIPRDKRELLGEIIEILTRLKLHAALNDYPISLMLEQLLSTRTPEMGTLNVWRTRAGGKLPDFTTGDKVIDALAPLLVEVYPYFLLKRENDPIGLALHMPIFYGHPAEAKFRKEILADNSLSKLFPWPASDAISTATCITTNTGCSGAMQLVLLSQALISAAYIMMRMRLQKGPDEFKGALIKVLSIARAVAEGKVVDVPTWVGFTNIALPGEVKFPWGVARPYPFPAELEFIPQVARPSITGEEGTTLGFILETTYSYQIQVEPLRVEEDSDPQWPKSMEEQRSKLQYYSDLTALAMTIGVERNPPVACNVVWTLTLDPFSVGLNFSYNSRVHTPVNFHILATDEIEQVLTWAQLLSSTSHSKIEIAHRRLLSAVRDRTNPVDGFVDAIIVWENLFAGTSQGELSFRICAAMSKLLEKDLSSRLALHKKLVELYNKRSKVVHGAQEISYEHAIRYRDESLAVGLQCLRKLFTEYPQLIADADRSKKLIMML